MSDEALVYRPHTRAFIQIPLFSLFPCSYSSLALLLFCSCSFLAPSSPFLAPLFPLSSPALYLPLGGIVHGQ